MIVTVSLNPAIDVSYQVPHFKTNDIYRVPNGEKTAGGKGLNVSRVLKILGCDLECTGFLGGDNGSWIQRQLIQEGLPHAFVTIKEETRKCLAIVDEMGGTQTELLEAGPHITIEEKEEFLTTYKKLLTKSTLIIASGSLPIGVPIDFYEELSKLAGSANIPFMLDTSGKALKHGINGKPFLIKPNQDELCQYAETEHLSFEEMVITAKMICRAGVKNVLVSLGEKGAIFVNEDHAWRADIPSIRVVNPVGSGDSMVAGMAYGLVKGFEWDECLRWACACGMANALENSTGRIQNNIVQKLLKKIMITEISEQ